MFYKIFTTIFFCLLSGLPLSFAQTLDQDITALMSSNNYPGLAVGVVKSQELVYEGYFGMADIANNTPVSAKTSFMLASVTKHFTHCAVNIAIESGAISNVNDPINNYLPFTVTHPTDPTIITIAMLLSHTSGIKDNWPNLPYLTSDPPLSALETYMQDYLVPGGSLYDASLNFQTNVGVSAYCNIGYGLLGLIVETATNTPFATYMKNEIYQPLCMNNSSLLLQDLNFADVAIPYMSDGSTPHGHYSYNDYAAGRMRSTVRDMADYAICMLGQGTMDAVTILSPTGSNFLNGGHGGGDKGVRTNLYLDKTTGVGIIVLSNGESDITPVVNTILSYIPNLITTTPDELCCQTNLTTVDPVLVYSPYEVSNDLDSDDMVVAGSSVDFTAGNSITLNTGFTVDLGAEFCATIQPCN